MIDVDDGLMKVQVQDEEVSFSLFEALQNSKEKEGCFNMDATGETIKDWQKQNYPPKQVPFSYR